MIRPARPHKVRPPRGEAPAPKHSLLVVHADQLLTLRGPTGARAREAAAELGIVDDGAVYAEGDQIVDVGPTAEVLRRHPTATTTLDASRKVVLPGFVDAHTHFVFAGSREREVEWKAQGLTYAEIAARGGGILHTVRATREASEADLLRLGLERLLSFVDYGTTTVEGKSGYGLRTADEMKILRAEIDAGRSAGVDVVPTFLGAHAVPPEFEGRADSYLDLLVQETLPQIAGNNLAEFCDVFVDEGYFSADQGREILRKAEAFGMKPKIHADELADTGGASLAAEVRAVSADHLLHSSDQGIDAMARSGVVATLLPATSLASKMAFADGRRLLAAGVPVALGTDFNPNTWCDSMQLAIALACHHNGLLPAEAITAATINAAHAVGRGDTIGSLDIGKLADLVVLDAPSYHHLGYRIGGNLAEAVVKRGRVRKGRSLTR
jgi:imidazolonepropionase